MLNPNAIDIARIALADRSRGRRATFSPPYRDYVVNLRPLFSKKAKIKIWGCNSGIGNWIYSDEDERGNQVHDLDAPASYYYWRALNEQNRPTPSIAQAFANYFQVSTYGATSGSSIQVLHQGRWIATPKVL